MEGDAPAASLTWVMPGQQLVLLGTSTTLARRVVFHLLNFPEFTSREFSVETVGTTQHRISHLFLRCDDHTSHIRSLPSTPSSAKALRDQGGFAVTHLGEIVRDDGGLIPVSEAQKVLAGLLLFFSFASGAWSPPILPVGFDENGQHVWECWDPPRVSSYIYTPSWFDRQNGQHLEMLWPGFMRLWANEEWQQAIHEAVYWYLNSNNHLRGIDAGIILTQAAIERLSFTYVVEMNKLLSLDGFKKASAADRFRLLFSSLGIPLDIPPQLKELTQLASAHNWADSPQGLTEMRNERVHVEHKKRGQFDKALYEAWNLGLWYAEMVVLRLCGYDGEYGNRLVGRSPGQVVKVPWSH